MYRNNEEKLADVMLGEAVLKLLHRGASLSCVSIAETLTNMAAHEEDPAKHRACLCAMTDVRTNSGLVSLTQANSLAKAAQLFASRCPTEDGKKH